MLYPRYRLIAATAFFTASVAGILSTASARAGEEPGLVGEFFQVKSSAEFPEIKGVKPVLVRVDKSIDFPEAGGEFGHSKLSDNFCALWTGSLKVDKAGEYTIFTSADDAVRVSIDGKVVLEDITKNGFSHKEAKLELTAGAHPIEVEFVQKGGEAGCILAWQPPGGEKQVIPEHAFSHEKAAEQIAWDKEAWTKIKRKGRDSSTWDALDYGPFLSASIDAPEFPGDMTYKGVAVKLGKVNVDGDEQDAAICFDTQLMRVSAGWTGGFLHLTNVAYTGDHGPVPHIAGEVKFRTRNAPAWAQKDGSFTDPRLALYGEAFGGMPRDYLHYKGLYRHGEQVIFSYSVNGMDVLETPVIGFSSNGPIFYRSFQIAASTTPQTMIVCEVENASVPPEGPYKPIGKFATLKSGNILTEALVAGSAEDGRDFKIVDTDDKKGKEIRLTIAPHNHDETFVLGVNSHDDSVQIRPEDLVAGSKDPGEISTLIKGGPAHWPQELQTKGTLVAQPTKEADKAAYVLDEITEPQVPSNWPRLRFGGFDFFPDGKSAALCTWNGDVYIVKGIDDTLEHLTWRRVAGGMFQTLGLKIIDGNIYVHGRDQITILHDLDGDGEADFYENFNNDVAMTDHFHEFAFALQQDGAGNLYTIKGGGVNPGGRGFQRPITRNHGTLMKYAKDGSKMEVLASGFRAPNGMCVREDGQVVTGDNQGSWTPVDRLNWIKPGMFCGVPELSHRTPEPTVTDNPLCWFPYPSWDNSCGDPVFVTSDKWGQPKNELFYLSYGQTSLMHILPEEVDGQMQGGAVRFPWHFSSGAMRARFNPVDGQLYVCGFQGWQTNAKRPTAFERVRFTGKKNYQPIGLHVKDKGIEITFAEPLKKDSVEDAGAWAIEQWNYRWSDNYGSPELKVSDPTKNGHDQLEVKSAKLSADGKTVFLEVANLTPVMQMLIRGNALEAADGAEVNVEIANTINAVGGKKLVVEVGKVEVK